MANETHRTAIISPAAALILGMDDMGRYPDIDRNRQGRYIVLYGAVDALVDIATELNDRATEGADGFNEAPSDKAVCRRAVIALAKQGIQARA